MLGEREWAGALLWCRRRLRLRIVPTLLVTGVIWASGTRAATIIKATTTRNL